MINPLMAELAACPFCGSKAELAGSCGSYVRCTDCEAEGVYKAFEDDAIKAWNTRTHHAELEAMARDKRRMDWLDALIVEGGYLMPYHEAHTLQLKADRFAGVDYIADELRTLIDAAMSEEAHSAQEAGKP